jgi:hypothetical protein
MIKKLEMKYLVLKLDAKIDINMLYDKLYNYTFDDNVTIKDIGVLILNCIIKNR